MNTSKTAVKMENNSAIYVAGHRGLVGSAILKKLKKLGYSNLIVAKKDELDLRDQLQVSGFFKTEKIDYVFLAAARVGGIQANAIYPAKFIYDNLMIQTNVINAAYRYGVKKLLFLGSSCIYPKYAKQPLKEEYLLTGALEPTNKAYAVAKIAGIEMCQAYSRQYKANFISVMPTNLYGPGDNFSLSDSHVLAALIKKFDDAKNQGKKEVVIWGTGKPKREFLHVDDLADAVVYLMDNYNSSQIINIGTGKDISINELVKLIKKVTGFKGKIIKDTSMPDGTPQKLLDVSKLKKLGWKAKISLEEGIRQTYAWYLEKNK